ncbi:hypothetical protein M404DRAFT_649850 [Pisolithus tinctorius Marx 270]|uniref:Uncharacterized protein n=1 Tax=Pisolithus tinctorius Marx 270 TaxID=870435 RepID=A0A0C3P4W5_PISTI|nr:hypothetical protein M404DRAFT_649850 [Pisolithus tinctorius Marx 270]
MLSFSVGICKVIIVTVEPRISTAGTNRPHFPADITANTSCRVVHSRKSMAVGCKIHPFTPACCLISRGGDFCYSRVD